MSSNQVRVFATRRNDGTIAIVRDPRNGRPVPPEGLVVAVSSYWQDRRSEGAVRFAPASEVAKPRPSVEDATIAARKRAAENAAKRNPPAPTEPVTPAPKPEPNKPEPKPAPQSAQPAPDPENPPAAESKPEPAPQRRRKRGNNR